jgi:hypothetical protein
MQVIHPYKLGNTWVFDDERTGLKEEAFVLGMSDIITRVVDAKAIKNATRGFALTFGGASFDHDVVLNRTSDGNAADEFGHSGTWYSGDILGQPITGWLCPALLLYFGQPPRQIFAKAEALPEGVDPIWHVAPGDSRARRFVSAAEDGS